MHRFVGWQTLAALFVSTWVTASVAGGPGEPVTRSKDNGANATMDRFIVKLREAPAASANADGSGVTTASTRAANIAQARTGRAVKPFLDSGGGRVVVKLVNRVRDADAAAIAAQIAADPAVEYAEPDARMYRMAVPNDPLYATSQTHYQARTSSNVWGINAPLAWDTTTGSTTVRIAVLDTGIITHADLNGNVLPGYDMISEANVANDGDARDANAADPGDWITSAESTTVGGPFEGCDVENSSWHGSHVAGTISAVSNNALGVAGVNWNARIIPVRVLGKCGGFLSDIADGIRWAAGLTVGSLPVNPNPAKIINMSLGGSGACGPTYQAAIDDVTAAGVIVVVSAGNSNAQLAGFRPASCNNVLPITSITSVGARSSFSNFGNTAFVAAPGSSVHSTINSGTQAPVASPGGDTYANYSGTSMAAPHAAGVLGLLYAQNPSLTIAQARTALAASAVPFVTPSAGTACFGNTCGAGMLDAAGALAAAAVATPTVAWATTSVRMSEGDSATLNIERFGNVSAAASVTVTTTAGTATSGSDYTAISTTVSWAAGEGGRKSVVLAALTDAANTEVDETLTVTIAPLSGGLTVQGSATITATIVNVVPCVNNVISLGYGAPSHATGTIAATDCQLSPDGLGYYADLYSVALTAGDKLTVNVGGTRSTGAIFDTFMYLLDPSGTVIAFDDDSGAAPLSLINRFTVPTSGVYKVFLTTYTAGHIGTYSLNFWRDAACDMDMNADSSVTASVEGLIFVRHLMGMSGAALLQGTGVTAPQYAAARTAIAANCGITLTP
jgi:serine protease